MWIYGCAIVGISVLLRCPVANLGSAVRHGSAWALNARQMLVTWRSGVISRLSESSEDDLMDKSKSNGLVMLIAVSQLLWLVL